MNPDTGPLVHDTEVPLTRRDSGASDAEVFPLDCDTEPVLVTIRTREADYVPELVHLRARIAPNMLTASVSAGSFPALEADPKVQSVSRSRRLRVQ